MPMRGAYYRQAAGLASALPNEASMSWSIFCRHTAAILVSVVIGASLPLRAQPPTAAPQVSREQLLETHMKDEKSGSAAAGRPVFEKWCAGCHRFGGIGKDVGPDLTTLTSRFKRRDILESILWPSKIISDQYQTEMLELNDGSVVTGTSRKPISSAVFK